MRIVRAKRAKETALLSLLLLLPLLRETALSPALEYSVLLKSNKVKYKRTPEVLSFNVSIVRIEISCF